MKIISWWNLGKIQNYHVVISENETEYTTGYGWNTPEESIERYNLYKKNSIPMKCKVSKTQSEIVKS